ncbi:diguanylate cyclase [Thiocapsa roseopersicina]|uniref:diguanylate cyclase n=1 Tax=Thiocapsa roseopersicina TaxID=1058 RepID=A0A1H2WTB3_THIRO|nr:diguanylate cyclase [Thiocapsa roseopersicina]SDW83199.1 response regulator receiver modulated diguanylate cyclase [Thiocapsa roseopersicina]
MAAERGNAPMPAAPNKAESFQIRKARLRASFLSQLPGRLADARRAVAELRAGEIDHAHLDALYILFHTLKGSGATFGFRQISDAAKSAEQAVRRAMDSGGRIEAALPGELEPLMSDLDALALAAAVQVDLEVTPGFELPEPEPEPASGQAPDTAPDARLGQPADRSQRMVYLCDDDPDLAAQLAGQLGCFGYRVRAFTNLADLREAVGIKRPSAMILDVVFPEDENAGPKMLAELRAGEEEAIPCIFISCRDDFGGRLQAVRAGGSAYCTKPIKTVELLEFLDRLTNPHPPEPINVLVVDDDRELAQFHATVLEEAGMVAEAVSDPEQVLSLLDTFDADLVLMDMYMPDCSGPELSRILRQIPGHVSLPIIYVSSETDVERQHKALAVGADGFLTKPIEPDRLIAEVSLRAERMRILHSLMVRDGLTGLFNHNAIMQFLEVAVANARRAGTSLCFAMIDVDHFKSVNDTYGHPTGDQVLMALSRTLRLRLREDDLVGRYGGEEFAVVLNGVGVRQAKCILDALRTSFSNVTFFSDGQEFRCTFSVGVSDFPTFDSPEAMTEAADRALYRAKKGGRNRVEIAAGQDALPEPSSESTGTSDGS